MEYLFHFIPFSFFSPFFFFFCIPEKGKCVQRIGSFACLSITASDTLFSFTRCNDRSTCATRDKLLLNYYSAIDTTAIYCAAAGYISKPMLLHWLSYRNSLPIFIRTINLYQKPSFDEKYLNQFLPIILIISDRTFDPVVKFWIWNGTFESTILAILFIETYIYTIIINYFNNI